MRLQRRLWILAVVWVAFWSLFPTFGRPRAFAAAIRSGTHEFEACNSIAVEKSRQRCWQSVGGRTQQKLDAITLRHEYAGYAPVWSGIGMGVPMVGAIVLMNRRRKLTETRSQL